MLNYQKNTRILNMHFVFMFVYLKMVEKWHMCIWVHLNLIFEMFCKFLCNALLLNGMINTLNHVHHITTLDHVIVHCLYIDHFVCIICYRIEVEPESEITPSVEHTPYEPHQQGKQTPIDHVDKIPLISQS